MKKITIIYGPAETGKTRLVNEIAKQRLKSGLVNYEEVRIYFDASYFFRHKFYPEKLFSQLNEKTTFLVIDDFPVKHLDELIKCLYAETIIVHKPRKQPFEIERPEIIITVDAESFIFPTGASFTRRFDLINLNSIDDYHREAANIKGKALVPELGT